MNFIILVRENYLKLFQTSHIPRTDHHYRYFQTFLTTWLWLSQFWRKKWPFVNTWKKARKTLKFHCSIHTGMGRCKTCRVTLTNYACPTTRCRHSGLTHFDNISTFYRFWYLIDRFFISLLAKVSSFFQKWKVRS